MNEEPKDAVDRLVAAYESMLERVHDAADTAEQKSVPWLREAVARGELRGDLDAGFAAVSVMSLAVYPFIALPVAREAAEIDMDQSTLERLVVHNTRLFCQGALPRPGSRDQQHDA